MPYQSNPDRTVEESYDSSSATGRLLPDAGVNRGASNSALGAGTTAAELTTKFRFLNCGAALFVLLFHTFKIVFNPIRLTMLLSTPVRLVLELAVCVLASCLLLVEARVPSLGERALKLTRGLGVSGNPCMDLDVARGRFLALVIMGGSLGLINYLARDGGVSSGKSSAGEASEEEISTAGNATEFGDEDASTNDEASAHTHTLIIMLQCTVLSPTTFVVFALAAYTLYVINTFPEYAESRAYSIEDGSDNTAAASSGPSWVSNFGEVVQGSGYQKVSVGV